MKSVFVYFLLIIAGVFSAVVVSASTNDPCINWFQKTGLKSETPDCELRCATEKATVGNAECLDRCDEFCSSPAVDERCAKLKSEIPKWFSNLRPSDWARSKETAKAWSQQERLALQKILEQMPEFLIPLKPVSLHRLQHPKYPDNPASTFGRDIALYDSAFKSDLRRVMVHELAHLYFQSLSRRQKAYYYTAANWLQTLSGILLPGRPAESFVAKDGMDSPEEDFANNIDTMAAEPARLKKVSPSLYQWLYARYGDTIIKGGSCGKM